MATIYARKFNQFKFQCRTDFSARFDKQDEGNQVSVEVELYIIS